MIPRPPPRIERLPDQYFTALLLRVREAAARDGEPLVDLGRGNPDEGPPAHVRAALAESASSPSPAVHGYAPFAGLPELRDAVAGRYRTEYGVELDPEREVAIVPGIKTALSELALCLAAPGDRIVLPDPGYPDYNSAVALAGAERATVPLDPAAGYAPDLAAAPAERVAALYLNYPSNPCAAAAPEGVFAAAVEYARRTGAAIVHDFAYGDLVFDGRPRASFLAEPGAREVGVELFSMSKTYGMAGWRLGFVVGNAELVARVTWLQEHLRAGIFEPLQRAAAAALTGPQESVAARCARYEARRDRVRERLGGLVELRGDATFFAWLRLPEGVDAARLLERERVAVAPGEGFGERGRGWARLSLAVSDEHLDAGLERLARAFRG